MSEEPISAAAMGLASMLGMGGAGAGALGAGGTALGATGAGLGAAGTAGAGTAAGLGAGAGTAAGLGAGAAGAGSAMMPVITSTGSTAMGPALEAILSSGAGTAAPASGGFLSSLMPMAKEMGMNMGQDLAMQSIQGLLGGNKQQPMQSGGVEVPPQAIAAAPQQPPGIPDMDAILQVLLRGIYPPDRGAQGRG